MRSWLSVVSSDILALQETRLSQIAQSDMAIRLAEHGFTAIWGKPMPPQRRKAGAASSAYNATHGGVGVLVRKGASARLGPVDTDARRRL